MTPWSITTDHIGSSSVVTDATGAKVVAENFGALGYRRGSSWTGPPSSSDTTAFASTTRRGFTGHEMMDNLQLVNMNGRIYGETGQFLSPDPFVTNPGSTQSYNRYAYVRDNPLTFTDPSGYAEDDPHNYGGDNSDDDPATVTVTASRQVDQPPDNQQSPLDTVTVTGELPQRNQEPTSEVTITAKRPTLTNSWLPAPFYQIPYLAPYPGGLLSWSLAGWSDGRLPAQPNHNLLTRFLCGESADSSLKQAADNLSSAGTAGDLVRPAVAIGAATAAASRGVASPQAVGFLGGEVAAGLSALGRVGSGAALGGIAYDVLNNDFSTALYDTADYFAYSALADAGGAGAIETLGGSIAAAGAVAGIYYNAGGSKGIVQSALCTP